MIKIENIEIYGWEAAIRGMRNPMNSWEKSDSIFESCDGTDGYTIGGCFRMGPPLDECKVDIGINDLKLMSQLAKAGIDHAKYRRMIGVSLDIIAPLYWWKEFDTYKIGTIANSCSTMHKIHEKEFKLEDFSCEHLTCWGAAPRGNNNGNLMEETISDFSYDYMGALLGIIYSLNSAREQFLKKKDKRYWWQMIQLLPSSYNQRRTVMLNYEVLANIYSSRQNHKLDEWVDFCKWIEELPYSQIITLKELDHDEKSN